MKLTKDWLILGGGIVFLATRPFVREQVPPIDSAVKALSSALTASPKARQAVEAAAGGATDRVSAEVPYAGTPWAQSGGSGTLPPVMPPCSYSNNDGSNGQSLPFLTSRPFGEVLKGV